MKNPRQQRRVIKPLFSAAAAILSAAFLTGCVTYSKVVEKPAASLTGLSPDLIREQAELLQAVKRQRREPMKALAVYLEAARRSEARLIANPADDAARKACNFALARVVSTLKQEEMAPWREPVRVPSEGGEFVITHKPDPRPRWNPELYWLGPADQFKVKGKYVSERVVREGVGAPVVAVAREIDPTARERVAVGGVEYGVTAIARFDGRTCQIAFEDPLASERTKIGGRSLPMAADFTVPLAAMLLDSENNPKKLGFARMFRPERFEETARVVMLEPYDPNKTVVLVIHGLTDSQATWTPMINHLRGDETFRRNYQVWFFSYPSGFPYPYSAALLRRELDRAARLFDLKRKIVVVGHSMGGCISRTLITDAGERIWRDIFATKPGKTPIWGEARDLLMESLIFDHRPEVGRVIFLSAPLQGSDLARIWLGRWVSSLIKLPGRLLDAGREITQVLTLQFDDIRMKRLPSSIDTLSPKNRFVLAINKIPVRDDIPHHTIIGDRGRGDSPDSSDGVVPYWSSHMETAVSERIVPSGHGTHQHPEGIAEVLRILKEYAGR